MLDYYGICYYATTLWQVDEKDAAAGKIIYYGNGRSWQDSCTALFFIFGVFFLTVFFYIQLFSFIYFVVFFILIWLFIISTATADPDKIRVPRSFLFSVFSFLLFSFIYNYFLLFIL